MICREGSRFPDRPDRHSREGRLGTEAGCLVWTGRRTRRAGRLAFPRAKGTGVGSDAAPRGLNTSLEPSSSSGLRSGTGPPGTGLPGTGLPGTGLPGTGPGVGRAPSDVGSGSSVGSAPGSCQSVGVGTSSRLCGLGEVGIGSGSDPATSSPSGIIPGYPRGAGSGTDAAGRAELTGGGTTGGVTGCAAGGVTGCAAGGVPIFAVSTDVVSTGAKYKGAG